MARHRTPYLARLLAALVLLTLVVSTAPTYAQDEGAAAADTTAPVIDPPADIVIAAADASGSVVSYSLPSAKDETDGSVDVACAPPSGSRFPLDRTTVTCLATDDAGNQRDVTFLVTVVDMTLPVIPQPPNLVVDAVEGADPVVNYAVPANDNVDGQIGTTCSPPSGSVFPVGATTVTCTAVDAAGNVSAAAAFTVVVNPPPATATPTAVPTSTDVPTEAPTDEPDATGTPVPTDEPDATRTPKPTKTPKSTATPSPTPTKTATATATPAKTPPALDLPWPPPESFTLVGDGGPLGGLAVMWENRDYPISQEFGHTWFSVRHSSWYSYGRAYGLDGFEHTGLDIGMPRGTPLYSPVAGTVMIAGGTPYFTYYGNGQPGVGELLIQTDDGNQIVLGHMGLITVQVGQRVEFGEFVGLSGGDNGDHLHLEVRHIQPGGGYLIVDPRRSFLIAVIEDAIAAQAGDGAVASSRRSDEADEPEGIPSPDDDPEELAGPR